MEAIGGVASVIALVEVTGKLATSLRTLAQRWHNAPEEMLALATTLADFTDELGFVRATVARGHPALIDGAVRQKMTRFLTEFSTILDALSLLLDRLEGYGAGFQKTRWAMKDARVARKMLEKLKEIEEGLLKWIALVTLKGQSAALDGVEATRNDLSAGFIETQRVVLHGVDEVKQMFTTVATASSMQAPASSASARSASASQTSPADGQARVQRVIKGECWDVGSSWESWGVCAKMITSFKGPHTDFDIHMTIRLPLAWILGSYALTGSLLLRRSLFSRSMLTVRNPSYFAIARVVADDHPFMEACTLGDVDVIRSMLSTGEGRVTDVTSDGFTPVSIAVYNEQADTLAGLLDSGVDIDGPVNPELQTALELAVFEQKIEIVRLLLHRGASQDHVDYEGFNTTLLCWKKIRRRNTTCFGIFNLLSENAFQDMNVSSAFGRTPLDVAAACSSGSSIEYLIRQGSDAHVGKSPIRFSTLVGNSSTHRALLSRYNEFASGSDSDFLLELLIFALCGKARMTGVSPDVEKRYYIMHHDEVVIDLLENGVDPRARTKFDLSAGDFGLLPEDLRGREITAHEVAAAYGPSIEAWFLSILRKCDLLTAHEDVQRLQELEEAGHGTGGFIYECEDDTDEGASGDDEDERSESGSKQACRKEEDDVARVSVGDESSELGNEDQFLDAEEWL